MQWRGGVKGVSTLSLKFIWRLPDFSFLMATQTLKPKISNNRRANYVYHHWSLEMMFTSNLTLIVFSLKIIG